MWACAGAEKMTTGAQVLSERAGVVQAQPQVEMVGLAGAAGDVLAQDGRRGNDDEDSRVERLEL